ncbi:hypothetical protein BDZ85DRAFT_257507, partial [Elsinoe ampelina]
MVLRKSSSLVICAGVLPRPRTNQSSRMRAKTLPTMQALQKSKKLPVAASTPSHVQGQVPTPVHFTMRLLVCSASFPDHRLKATLFILDTTK